MNRLLRFLTRNLLIILVILMAIALPTTNVQAQENTTNILTVTGSGEQMIPATIARVDLGVEVQGLSADTVQQQVAEQSNAVVELLRSAGVDKLQTTGIRLQPIYDYSNDQRELIGYRGTNTVGFRYDTTRVGSLIDQAVQAGATRIDNISFTATDEAINQAQKQALQAAVADAQAQAEAVLQSLNLRAKEVRNIQINSASVPTPLPYELAEADSLRDAASTPVVGGEQNVNASVTLQISY